MLLQIATGEYCCSRRGNGESDENGCIDLTQITKDLGRRMGNRSPLGERPGRSREDRASQ
jgi:hypothetical protein